MPQFAINRFGSERNLYLYFSTKDANLILILVFNTSVLNHIDEDLIYTSADLSIIGSVMKAKFVILALGHIMQFDD